MKLCLGMDEWCHRSCLSYPPNCPTDKCQCLSHCDAVGRLAHQEGTDVFCHRKCLRFVSYKWSIQHSSFKMFNI